MGKSLPKQYKLIVTDPNYKHSSGGYDKGCRCDVCRIAKNKACKKSRSNRLRKLW